MPRRPRIVIPDIPHHITQRGNNKQDIFFTEDDRQKYLCDLKIHSQEYGFTLLGYCLMTNHIHLIGIPSESDTLTKVFARVHLKYTQRINQLHNRSGHFWQNRFFSCALDEQHLFRAMAYIETNPIRAKLVPKAMDYPWSSARSHVEGNDRSGLIDTAYWLKIITPQAWKSILDSFEDTSIGNQLVLHDRNGRPLGSDSFVSKLETLIGKRLRPLAHGRPCKKDNK
ncbi:MAG TPA: transposase [Thermoanaerobaculia bacterium]|nr:transposase [Thermoanaerobaculia bacterium]HUM31079.1 transposase [Thermoanaerobaculia bacterium]HXK69409.1 transposase [Thermoanaerobaculia bacterium]